VTEYELVAAGSAEDVAKALPKETARDKVLEPLVNGANDAESLASEVGITYGAMRKLLGELLKEGVVVDAGKQPGTTRKRYAIPGQQVA